MKGQVDIKVWRALGDRMVPDLQGDYHLWPPPGGLGGLEDLGFIRVTRGTIIWETWDYHWENQVGHD